MKKWLIGIVMITLCLFTAISEVTQKTHGNGFSFGAGLSQAAGDFGFQGTITSPWFFRNSMALRTDGFMLYNAADSWTPYYGFKIGLIGGSFMASADIRLYGEGGFTFLFPSTHFDNDDFVLGGYGHFGLEFFIDRVKTGLAYYVELGSNGIGATAEKGSNAPYHYMNGFETTVGLRYYPKF